MVNGMQNVYEMLAAGAFTDSGGLWVVRNSWAGTQARIVVHEPLDHGQAPYFAGQRVFCDLFHGTYRYGVGVELSGAGTYAYTRIPAPAWWLECLPRHAKPSHGVSGS